jgi:hypothetical protein
MAREFPVGTIRHWASGDVIKAHSPIHPFSDGWIPLKDNSSINRVGNECDSLARSVKSYDMPINGEKFLDHEIDEFKDEDDQKPFNSGSFKQYEGFYGAGRYAFRNEFYRRFMQNDMSLDEQIMNAFMEVQEERGGDKTNSLVSIEERKEIRERVKRDFKDDPNTFTIAKAEKLKDIVSRTFTQLKEGVDFKDPAKKELYEDFLIKMDSLPEFYDKIKVKRSLRNEWLRKIDEEFDDNWGVRESCKDYANRKFDKYVRNFTDQIAKDSLDDQLEKFGVDINMEPDEFYSKIYDKVANEDYVGLEEYVGREMTFFAEKTWGSDIRFKAKMQRDKDGYFYDYDGKMYVKDMPYNKVKFSKEYDQYDDFKELIYLRFITKYNKSVEGDWKLDHLPAIHNLENAIISLPVGHFLTNAHLNLITNKSYKGGSHGGYAWYEGGEKRINFSADCIDRGTVFGVLANPTEFKSTLLHEIGHSVSKKLGRTGYYDYKRFAVECGWTYESPELRAGMTATGDDKDIRRTGSNSSVKLISDYAGKSPEEAFAEYYSFYANNKQRIDNFLNSGDKNHLNHISKTIAVTETSERSIGNSMHNRILNPSSSEVGKFREAMSEVSYTSEHNRIELISPWDTKLTKYEKGNVKTEKLAARKNYSIASMPPIISYADGAKNIVIDGATRVEVARMNKRLVPSITISKELYFNLQGKGLSEHEIADCIYTHNRNESLIKEALPTKIVHGLIHRDHLIQTSQIVQNANVLKAMRDIYNSEALKKAMEDLFSFEENVFEKAFSEGSINEVVLNKLNPINNSPIQKAYLAGIVPEDMIEKAWKKHPIGTTITRKDGQKYTKVSETGNSDQDWKLASKTKTKSGKPESKGNSEAKIETDTNPQPTTKELKKHAQNTSEQELENAIKQSSDSEVRKVANQEIERRNKEEKPQEEEKKPAIAEKKKEDKPIKKSYESWL